jgi:glutamate synthase (NADPH/NADH) small chain
MSDVMNFGFLGEPRAANGRRVAIVGAGPSGLAAAGYLASRGYRVEVYDKLPQAGGLMMFAIPERRIQRERVRAGAEQLRTRYGVRFHFGTKICGSTPMHDETGDEYVLDVKSLGGRMEDNDAVLVCTGTWKSRSLRIPGEGLPGVMSSLAFLLPLRAGQSTPGGRTDLAGKRVIVVGAGHSAVDAAYTAQGLGAAVVTIVYRRTKLEAPCGIDECEDLAAAGVRFVERVSPLRFLASNQDGGAERLAGIEVLRDGRYVTLPADVCVTAIGEIPTPPMAHELGLDNMRSTEAHWLQMTSLPGVFVAGDVLTGPSKIGRAVYSGLRAARSLHDWLELKSCGREKEWDARSDRIAPATDRGGAA